MYVKPVYKYTAICLCAYMFFFASCKETEKNKNAADMNTDMPVSVVSVKETAPDNSLSSFGTVTYKSKNDVTALVAGTVTSMLVKEGDFVRKEQVIAYLRNVQLEMQKEQYLNSLDSAKAALELAKTKLREDKLSVESRILALDKSQLTIQQKELELESEKETLAGKTELHAIGGITDAALRQLQLQEHSSETEIAVLKKEQEIAELGLRNKDLIENGYTPADNEQAKLDQLVELNTQSTKAQILSAEADVKNAQQSLTAVEKLIEELTIRSPSAGVVGARYYENGEYIKENEKVVTIMDISSVYAVFYIQEQDMVNFVQGAPLTVELPSLHENFKTRINEISPAADPQSGNFSVKTLLPNGKRNIRPGMFVKCTLEKISPEKFCMIPETALINKNNNSAGVFCIAGGHAVMKTVTISSTKDGFVWLKKGLSSGDIVIDKPSPFLREGQNVHTK